MNLNEIDTKKLLLRKEPPAVTSVGAITRNHFGKISWSAVMEALSFLINSPSKKVVDQIFLEVFKVRNVQKAPPVIAKSLETALKLSNDQAQSLFEGVKYILRIAVYENSSSLDPLFPEKFHKDLKTLILQIITAHLSDWRKESLNEQISLPKLKAMDWRVDVKRSSDAIANLSQPTVLVQLTVEDNSTEHNNQKERTVNFELSKQTLETMLDGLKRIKDQLGSLKS